MAKRIVLRWGEHRTNATLDDNFTPETIELGDPTVVVWREGIDRPTPPFGAYHLVRTRPIEYQWEGDQ